MSGDYEGRAATMPVRVDVERREEEAPADERRHTQTPGTT